MANDGGNEPLWGHKNLGHFNDGRVEGSDARTLGSDLNHGNDHKLFHDLHKEHLKIAQTTVNSKFGPCLIVEEKIHGHEVKFEIYGNKKEEHEHGLKWHELSDGKWDITFADGNTIHFDGVITNKYGQQIDRSDSANPNSTKYKALEERAKGGTELTSLVAEINMLASSSAGATAGQLEGLKSAAASLGRSNQAIASAAESVVAMLDNCINSVLAHDQIASQKGADLSSRGNPS